jgi:hypothetical protein
MRPSSVASVVVLAVALVAAPLAPAVAGPTFTPGAPSVGDPYFPGDGNGGYDVRSYDLRLSYAPGSDRLAGVATIRAKATQNLSRFNLDLAGLTVRSVAIDGKSARWTRAADELTVVPRKGLVKGRSFAVKVTYDGVPQTLDEFGLSGFIHTDDGALIAGQPHVSDTWFPSNDHPSDKASFHVEMKVPAGLTAVGNGRLVSKRSSHGWTTWVWDAPEPMATYLATATVGNFDLRASRHGKIKLWDAVDPALYEPLAAARTGSRFLYSGQADSSYKRLTRTIAVPAGGASVSFWVTRDTEQPWDFFFVEAHHPGVDDWTTLPDANGHTSQDGGAPCPFWVDLHPFLAHYQSGDEATGCIPTGTSGEWNAASGASTGYEQWTVDLGAYAGSSVELSLAYASDESFQMPGVAIDDVVVSTGQGSTSFEADAEPLDGWVVAGAPAGSPGNATDWAPNDGSALPPPLGAAVDETLAREGEILDFLSANFGRYPFATSGGVVDDVPALGFALENQTRPIYAPGFFAGGPNSGVVVHELAHQWYGDSLAVRQWKDIWLNEGFATYAEWLWGEHEGEGTVHETFDFWYHDFAPPDDPFWQLTIGDPGPESVFDFPVYVRGAMTLQVLRDTVGDTAFFRILRTWASQHRGGNVHTDQFVALAERISGQQLDALFEAWLFTPGLPGLTGAAATAAAKAAASSARSAASVGRAELVPGGSFVKQPHAG